MNDTFSIRYEFTLAESHIERFDLTFDSATIELNNKPISDPPFWTKLDFARCPHCRIDDRTQNYCPAAINLAPVISRMGHLMSFDRVIVQVSSSERDVVQPVSAQEGIGSLMGLLIAGSSCPLTHFFKPMARFHLPFANKNETMWRAAATYLLSRYFSKNGLGKQDMDLKGLTEIYDDIAKLNHSIITRLRAATSNDSAVNALVRLDVFAKFLTPPLKDSLQQLQPFFYRFMSSKNKEDN